MKSDQNFLVRGSIINGLGLITRVVSPFLIILLARFYPQKELGLFISFQALVFTLSRVALLGLDKGLMWYVPNQRRQEEGKGNSLAETVILTSMISLLIIACFSVAGAVGWLSRFHALQGMSVPFMLLMVGSVWPFSLIQVFSSALEGRRLPQYRVYLALFVTTSLVPVFAFLFKRPLGDQMSLAAGMFLGNLAGALLFLPVIRARFSGPLWTGSIFPAPELLRYSLPLSLSELTAALLGRVDLWMILFLLGPEKAAVYAVMVTITNGLRTVRQTFDPLLIPIVSNLNGEELATKLKASFSYATNMVSTIQLFIASFIIVFPREILSVAGKGYAIEVYAFALLLLGNLVNGFLGLNGLVLLGMGKSRFILGVTVSALALNLLCNWIFIPRLGIAGAGLAYCVNLLYQNLAHYLYVRFGQRLSLYEPHLYLNGALEVGFLALFFSMYRRIEGLSLFSRCGLFALLAMVLASVIALKRKSYFLS